MGSKSPTWADQWGNEDDKPVSGSKGARLGGSGGKKKMEDVKAAASAGFDKAKAAAAVGAQKLKTGTSSGIKWVKKQCDKKSSSK